MNWLLLNACLLLTLFAVVTSTYSNYDDVDDVGYERGRRGWSMMRLGRGLQMLRLGKRSSLRRLQDKQQQLQQQRLDDGEPPISPEQLRVLLAAMLDESREESRRMPPLPRYGRELDVKLESSDDIYPSFNDDSWPHPLPIAFSTHFPNSRFKRDVDMSDKNKPLDEYLPWADFVTSRSRAVALPRIGRYLGRLRQYSHRPAKAVPAPRIGRQELEQGTRQGEHMTEDRAQAGYRLDSEQKVVDIAVNN